MKVTTSGGHIKVQFPYNERLKALVKTIPGREWDGSTKSWDIPIGMAHRIPELFGDEAQFSYDAIAAICDAEAQLGERFYRMCRRLGVALHIDADGHVCASGDNVSQLVATEVRRRSDMLLPYVQAERDEAPPLPFADAVPTEADERLATGLQNAWEADQRKRQIVAGQRRKQREGNS